MSTWSIRFHCTQKQLFYLLFQVKQHIFLGENQKIYNSCVRCGFWKPKGGGPSCTESGAIIVFTEWQSVCILQGLLRGSNDTLIRTEMLLNTRETLALLTNSKFTMLNKLLTSLIFVGCSLHGYDAVSLKNLFSTFSNK